MLEHRQPCAQLMDFLPWIDGLRRSPDAAPSNTGPWPSPAANARLPAFHAKLHMGYQPVRHACHKGATGVSMRRWPSGYHPEDAVRREELGLPDQYRQPSLCALSVGALYRTGGGEDAHRCSTCGGNIQGAIEGKLHDVHAPRNVPDSRNLWFIRTEAHRVQRMYGMTINFCGASAQSGKTLVFITNNFSLPAATISRSTKAAGRWNSSSSGSSSIFGSSSSTARRRTR